MGNYISNGHHPFRRRGTVDGGVVHGLAGILSMQNADGQSGAAAAAATSSQQHQGMSIGFGSVSAVGAMMRRPSNPNTNKISVCRTSRSASRASSAGAGGGGGSKKTTVSSSHDSSSQLDEMTPPPPPLSELDRLKGELRDAKRQIYEREQQLLKLHREIHKLRSVLDHSDAMNALKPSLSMTMLLSAEHNNNNNNGKLSYPKKQGVSGESYGSMTSLGDPLQNINFVWKDFDCRRIIQEALQDNSFLKNYLNLEQLDLIVDSMYEKEFSKNTYICRRGTYGSHLYILTYGHCEVIDAHDKPVNQMGPGKAFGELALLYNCTRTASVKTITRVRTWVLDRKVFQMIMMKTCLDKSQTIKQFLKSVPLLRELSDEKISKIGDVVEVDYYPRGDYICRQGSSGDSFYIISKGSCRVTQIRHGHFSPDGHGSSGAKSKNGVAPFVKEETIRTLKVGDYFGEQALLLNLNQPNPFLSGLSADNGNSSVVSPTRTANVISEDCECLVLDQSSFFSLLGDLNEIRYKSYNDSEEYNATITTTAAAASAPSSAVKSSANADSSATAAAAASVTSKPLTNLLSTLSLSKKDLLLETNLKTGNQKTAPDPFFYRLTLDDLEHLCQLGQGGFGMVNLVRAKSDPTRVFALKRCSKEFVRASHQEQHIINEKLVMQRVSGRHQFLIQLHRTFRDEKNVYFLMETALGGELWSVLRQRGPFSEQACRFYMGCVIEALQYLHSNNIIYRDLKPENCLLDSDGYLKLTDFGFSKFLQPGDKTWTFCGTPEYVSPEIVLNRGHDKSVDIWSIGILLYELLTGIPPFTSNDPLQTYHIILRGFDSIGFDEGTFSKHCVNLIRALCKENPTERLGVRGRNGYADIKKHKWFAGFNWSHLVARKLAPPIIPSLTSDTDTRYFDTVPLKPDGSRFSPVGPICAGTGTVIGGQLTTAPTTTTGNKSPSFMLHKSSAKLSSLSSPNTSSSNSSDAGKLNVSKANNESSKESSLQFDYSCDWESYF